MLVPGGLILETGEIFKGWLLYQSDLNFPRSRHSRESGNPDKYPDFLNKTSINSQSHTDKTSSKAFNKTNNEIPDKIPNQSPNEVPLKAPDKIATPQITIGEVVFNTSHSGYEEIASDPSYYNQILLMTAPMQGNYAVQASSWQSGKIQIKAFVCVEMQNSLRDSQWLKTLKQNQVPVLYNVDTRSLVLRLRDKGVVWGAVAPLSQKDLALQKIKKHKDETSDWTQKVCVKDIQDFKGKKKKALKLALIDFGYKKSILQELLKYSSELRLFPSNSPAKSVKEYQPSAIVLSNGPGDPKNVIQGTHLVKSLLSYRPMLGICMGHQILAQALGAKTYKLKFGHRGSNHPIKDNLLNRIYISAQNHGYAVLPETLPPNVSVSHSNLNDNTVAGIMSKKYRCLSMQFHPENKPGPTEAQQLFTYFFKHFVSAHAS